MTILVAALLIVAVAGIVTLPFVHSVRAQPRADVVDSRERLEREKNVALLAIREADLDRAMGKLSDEDYATLRTQYQQRAAGALRALEKLGPRTAPHGNSHGAASSQLDRFCGSCGRRYLDEERFCPACGHRRLGVREAPL